MKKSTQQSKGPSNSGANTRAFTLNQFAIEVLRKDGVSVRDAQNLVRNLSPDEIKNLCEINGLYMSGPLEEEAATAAASAPAPAAFVNASHPDDDHHLPEGQNPAVDVCGACVASPEAAHS